MDKNKELFEAYAKCHTKERKDEIFLENQKLVFLVINKYKHLCEYDDLYQEAMIGLYAAIDAYDPNRGAFSTFAISYINGYVMNYLYQQGSIFIPLNIWNLTKRIRKERERMQEELGRTPTDRELREACQATDKEWEWYLQLDKLRFTISLSSKSDPEGLSLEDKLGTPGPSADELFRKQISDKLLAIVKEVSEGYLLRERCDVDEQEQRYRIFTEYMGFVGDGECTFQTLADKYGMSKQNANNIVGRMMRRLNSPEYRMKIRNALGVPQDVKDCDVLSYLYDKEDAT